MINRSYKPNQDKLSLYYDQENTINFYLHVYVNTITEITIVETIF